jgi:hypothetical protein
MKWLLKLTSWTKYQIILMILLLVSGAFNSIMIAWMNSVESMGTDKQFNFVHPFYEADVQYFGKILCLGVLFSMMKILSRRGNGSENKNCLTKGSRKYNFIAIWPPAMLDLISTFVLVIGMAMTNHFSFLSLQGVVIVFTAGFSKYKLQRFQWIAIVFILLGFIFFGFGDVFEETDNKALLIYAIESKNASEILFNSHFSLVLDCPNSTNNDSESLILLGDLLIIFAQIAKGFRIVYEEEKVKELDLVPLVFVGWEGIFSFMLLTSFIVISWFIPNDQVCLHRSEVFTQMKNSPILCGITVLVLLSSGVFHFAGIAVTKELTATTRVVLEAALMTIVWVVKWNIGWREFHWLQVRKES